MAIENDGKDWFAQRYAVAAVVGTYSAVILALGISALAGRNLLDQVSPWVAVPTILIAPLFIAVPISLLLLPASYVVHRFIERYRLQYAVFHCLAGIVSVASTVGVALLVAFLLSSEPADPYEAHLPFGPTQWPMELAFHATWILSSAIGGYAFFATRILGKQPHA